MLVGDFLCAMSGYYEAEAEKVRSITELVRLATTYFVNTQPIEGGSRTPQDLWPLPWDKKEEVTDTIPDEEKKQMQDKQDEILKNNF
jgi:hypothetical protein